MHDKHLETNEFLPTFTAPTLHFCPICAPICVMGPILQLIFLASARFPKIALKKLRRRQQKNQWKNPSLAFSMNGFDPNTKSLGLRPSCSLQKKDNESKCSAPIFTATSWRHWDRINQTRATQAMTELIYLVGHLICPYSEDSIAILPHHSSENTYHHECKWMLLLPT